MMMAAGAWSDGVHQTSMQLWTMLRNPKRCMQPCQLCIWTFGSNYYNFPCIGQIGDWLIFLIPIPAQCLQALQGLPAVSTGSTGFTGSTGSMWQCSCEVSLGFKFRPWKDALLHSWRDQPRLPANAELSQKVRLLYDCCVGACRAIAKEPVSSQWISQANKSREQDSGPASGLHLRWL